MSLLAALYMTIMHKLYAKFMLEPSHHVDAFFCLRLIDSMNVIPHV